jgi:hypothetical protein
LLAHVIEIVTAALPESDFDALSDEFHSMFELARLSGLEMLHYVKHLMRGWWQDTAIKELKRMMLSYPWLKGCVTDHKNKLLPRCKDEAMSMFFSKAGISILGAMVFWAGTKEVKGKEVKGLFIWFIDMVMENTTSQEARDLMPCIEVLRGELQQDYFVDMAGPTKGLFLLSDNALVDASLSAFIHAHNQQCLAKSMSDHTRATLLSSSSSEESFERCESPTERSLPEDRIDSTEIPVDEIPVDEFVANMQSLYQSKIGNWESHVEPYISQWLTWEAQRCKTELDTHFAYINKQLAKACLEGGIDYLDAAKVFEALSYGGGARATTALLVQELVAAQAMFDACKKAVTDRKGISSVHDIKFEPSKITHSFFSNLDTEKTEITPNDLWPVVDCCIGKISARHIYNGDPLFFPFKELLNDNADDDMQDLDPRLLATRVYTCFLKHSADVSFASQDSEELTTNEDLQKQIDEMAATMEELFADAGEEMFNEELGFVFTYPCSLPLFWAKKKNRTYMTLSEEVRTELARMFLDGQGSTNKALRYSAERAVMELSSGLLKFLWDQKLICSISKVKSFFSRKHQMEQTENDANRQAASEESINARRERGERLLADNQSCTEAVLQEMDCPADSSLSLELAEVNHFHRISVSLLRAFIKCRQLDDATSTSLDKLMPKKGSLKEARDGAIYHKTMTPFLSRWAHDLRLEPVKAKVIDPSKNEARQELDLHLFVQAINTQQESFEFQEDLANDITLERQHNIEEINSDEVPEDEDSDDELELEDED